MDQTVALEEKPQKFGYLDFGDIKGQEHVKRAMEVAVTGGHNLLIVGPKGTGKTTLARAMASILPDLELEEKAALFQKRLWKQVSRTHRWSARGGVQINRKCCSRTKG